MSHSEPIDIKVQSYRRYSDSEKIPTEVFRLSLQKEVLTVRLFPHSDREITGTVEIGDQVLYELTLLSEAIQWILVNHATQVVEPSRVRFGPRLSFRPSISCYISYLSLSIAFHIARGRKDDEAFFDISMPDGCVFAILSLEAAAALGRSFQSLADEVDSRLRFSQRLNEWDASEEPC